jgi:excisionase family DNA binding protein
VTTDMGQGDYLTVTECATGLRLSPMTVYRMVAQGELAAIRTGVNGRTIRILRVSYEEHQHRAYAGAPATAPVPMIPGQEPLAGIPQ